ncbi:hypothetical protein ABTZ57_41500 [Streptomyces sp. NPDC094048]
MRPVGAESIAEPFCVRLDIGAEWPDWPQELVVQEAVARQIANAYSPGLGNIERDDADDEPTY